MFLRIFSFIVVSTLLVSASPQDRVQFDDFFGEGALRLDIVHSGTDSTEEMGIRRVVQEPIWSGCRSNLIPEFDRGRYRLDVRDAESGRLIFRIGFSTLFGEWQTTEEAHRVRRAFEETLETPFPKFPVEIEVSARRDAGGFEALLMTSVDPASPAVGRRSGADGVKVHDLIVNGSPGENVDVLILGDGYTVIEREKFLRDCARRVDDFLGTEPFASNGERLSFRAIFVPSAESGIDEPRKGIYRDTPFGMSFNTFDSPRYCMTEDVWAIHDAAAAAPHDAILLMANTSRYGGGAIYNFYTAFASDNEYDDYLCVHEFGHGFGGLADEYYSSAVSYNDFYPRGVEPWEPNITALLDPDHLKWGALVRPGTPVPTPADDRQYADEVGAFEGAGYAAKGLYRPAKDCKMFSKGNRKFCPVCSRALVEVIRFYAPD